MVLAALLLALGASVAGGAAGNQIIAFGTERGGPFRIHLLGLTSRTQRTVGSDYGTGVDAQPSWSPDGRRLAFSTSDPTGTDFDIAVSSWTGFGRKRITSGPAWDEHPAWSPNGAWIAFGSDRTGNFDIWVVRPNGTGLRQLTGSTCDDTEPTWSPDGRQIAFTSRRGGFPHVWVMNADGTGPRRIVKQLSWSPAWSPDGKQIAFVGDRGVGEEIFALGVEDGVVTQLTDNNGIDDEAPTWSRDSSRIAFVSLRDGDSDVFEMRRDGTGARVIVGGVWTETDPAWRP